MGTRTHNPLTVVVPLWDPPPERSRRFLEQLAALTVEGQPPAVIVVDDGNPPGTLDPVLDGIGALVVHHDHNRGKGAAVHTGLVAASRRVTDLVAVVDGDGDIDPADVGRLAGVLLENPGVDAVLATKTRIGHRGPARAVLSAVARTLSRALTGVPDANVGLKVLRARAVEVVLADGPFAERFAGDLDLVERVVAHGLTWRVEPVRIHAGDHSTVRVRHLVASVPEAARVCGRALRRRLRPGRRRGADGGAR